MSRAELHPPLNGTLSSALTCPQCGCDLSKHPSTQESQRRIEELEAQVRLLNEKATAAVDKLADYEDEVRYLRSQRQQQPTFLPNGQPNHRPAGSDPAAASAAAPPPTTTTTVNRLANLTSFIPGRRPSPSPNAPTLQSPAFPPGGGPNPRPPTTPYTTTFFGGSGAGASNNSPSSSSLASELAHERSQRQKLEAQLNAQSSEVEELTAQLFSQANEMVATERKAKAKLEERIRLLETEWKARTDRLKKLEERVGRSERIRSMLSGSAASVSTSAVSDEDADGAVNGTATRSDGGGKRGV